MPEVVEVRFTAEFLNYKLKNKQLDKVSILGGRYSRHKLKGLDTFDKILPLTIKKVDSKGKFLWFELEDKEGHPWYIFNTFGLKGEWGFTLKKHSGVSFHIYKRSKSKTNMLYFTD